MLLNRASFEVKPFNKSENRHVLFKGYLMLLFGNKYEILKLYRR